MEPDEAERASVVDACKAEMPWLEWERQPQDGWGGDAAWAFLDLPTTRAGVLVKMGDGGTGPTFTASACAYGVSVMDKYGDTVLDAVNFAINCVRHELRSQSARAEADRCAAQAALSEAKHAEAVAQAKMHKSGVSAKALGAMVRDMDRAAAHFVAGVDACANDPAEAK